MLKLCRAEGLSVDGLRSARSREAEDKLGVSCGSTTADGRVTFEAVCCLGLCATAPSAMIDGQVVGRLTPKKLDAILKGTQA